MTPPYPQIMPEGLDRMVVRFAPQMTLAANRAARAFRAGLEAEGWPGVVEISAALVSVLVRFDPRVVSHAAVRAHLVARLADLAPARAGAARRWRIPCAFGGDNGPDLADAAALAGVSVDRAVQELSAPVEVLAIGFAPGQPYLGQLPAQWDTPRRGSLNPQVPAGALVTAVRQFVLFANPSPTGWRQVGLTGFACFRPDTDDPFPLAPGDRVTFAPVSADRLAALIAEDPLGGGATLELP